jgi:Tfp pilus assembly protein PilE
VRVDEGSAGNSRAGLAIAVAIAVVVAVVAVPLYFNLVRDAARAVAREAIDSIVAGEQFYYRSHGTYTADTAQIRVDLSHVGRHWRFGLGAPAGGSLDRSFRVTADGISRETRGLQVTCTYVRGQTPAWSEK